MGNVKLLIWVINMAELSVNNFCAPRTVTQELKITNVNRAFVNCLHCFVLVFGCRYSCLSLPNVCRTASNVWATLTFWHEKIDNWSLKIKIYCINTFIEGTFSSWKLNPTSLFLDWFLNVKIMSKKKPSPIQLLFALNNTANVVLSVGYAPILLTADELNTELAVGWNIIYAKSQSVGSQIRAGFHATFSVPHPCSVLHPHLWLTG